MSLGGVLGGLFNALVAPLVFTGAVEYPLMLAAACLLRPRVAALGARGMGPRAAGRTALGCSVALRRAGLDCVSAKRAHGIAALIFRSAETGPGAISRRGHSLPAPPTTPFRAGDGGFVGTGFVLRGTGRTRSVCGAQFLRRLTREGSPLLEKRTRILSRLHHAWQPKPGPVRAARAVGLLQPQGTVGTNLPRTCSPAGRWLKSVSSGWARERSRPTASPASGSRSTRSTRPWNASPATRNTSPTSPIVALKWRSFWVMHGSRWFTGRNANSTFWWSTPSVPIRCPST